MNEIVQTKTTELLTDTASRNPFQNQNSGMNGNLMSATTHVECQRVMAETQARVYLAKQFPRNQKTSCDNILIACQRPQLAESALYSYSRGGTPVTGPSIRLAEMLAQEWGNIMYGYTELEQTRNHTVAQAYAWNLENNVFVARDQTIPHKRYTKNGTTILTDPRDIYEMVANQMARRVRACILAVIPGDVVEMAVNECQNTMKIHVDITPEKVRAMVAAFGEWDITRGIIEKFIQRSIEAITPANMVRLRTIYQSLKDGMANPEDFFDMTAEPKRDGKAKLEGMKSQLISSSSPASVPASTPAQEVKPTRKKKEIAPKSESKPEMPSMSENEIPEDHDFDWYMEELDRCTTRERLEMITRTFAMDSLNPDMSEGDYITIQEKIAVKKEELGGETK